MEKPKFIHTMWSTPSLTMKYSLKDEVKDFKKNFYTYFLSVLMLKKHGYEIDLYCDRYTYEYYRVIPYNNIYVYDFDRDKVDRNFWIYAKMKVMSMQKRPFVHIDGDVIFMNNIFSLDKFNEFGCVVQMVEDENIVPDKHLIYKSQIQLFNRWLPNIKWDKFNYSAYNCGVIGFSDMELKDKYVDTVINNIKLIQNKRDFEPQDFKMHGLCLITEQLYLYNYLVDQNKKPYEILDKNVLVSMNWDINKLSNDIGYIHLWGSSKYKNNVINNIKRRIKVDFPDHANIIDIYEESIQ